LFAFLLLLGRLGLADEMRILRRIEAILDGVEEALTTADALSHLGIATQGIRWLDVLRRLAGVLDGEGGIGHAEEAGTDALSDAADADEGRQRQFLRGQERSGDGADVGVLNDRVGESAGVHEGGAAVVAPLVARQ